MTGTSDQAIDALIFTALGLETAAVLNHLSEATQVQIGKCWGSTGTFQGMTVGVIEVGPGNSTAAAAAAMALSECASPIAAFLGVAGGVKDVSLGDVVVATKVYGYETGKEKATSFAARGSGHPVDWELEQRARAIRQATDWYARMDFADWGEKRPTIFVEPIAAGEKVIASNRSKTAKLIKENYSDAVAVEMEGRGFLDGVRISGASRGIVIRGISDLLSGKAVADAHNWQPRAAAAAAAVLFQILSLTTPRKNTSISNSPDEVTSAIDYRLLNGRTKLLEAVKKTVNDSAPRSYANLMASLQETKIALEKADEATKQAAIATEAVKSRRPSSRSENSPDPLIVKSGNLGLAQWSSGDEYLGQMNKENNWGLGVYLIYTISKSSTPNRISTYRGEVVSKSLFGSSGAYEMANGTYFFGSWLHNRPRRGYMSFTGQSDAFDFYFGEFQEYQTKFGNLWKPGGQGVGISLATRTITCGLFDHGAGVGDRVCTIPLD